MKIRSIVGAVALTAGGVVGFNASPADAGCNITLELHNRDSSDVTVDWDESKVKIQGGLWNDLGNGSETIEGGDTLFETVNTTFNCGVNRRWQFRFEDGSDDRTEYFPSETGWTTQQTIHVHADF